MTDHLSLSHEPGDARAEQRLNIERQLREWRGLKVALEKNLRALNSLETYRSLSTAEEAERQRTKSELADIPQQMSRLGTAPADKVGNKRHIAHDTAQWTAICSQPDFCWVGPTVVPFDSFATLDKPVLCSPNVKARGTAVYRQGDIFNQVQANAGAHVVAGTSLGAGCVKLLDGHSSVKVNGIPVARHGSACLINCNPAGIGGALGKVYTSQAAASSNAERPMGERMADEAGRTLSEKWKDLKDSAKTVWEATPLTSDELTTQAARGRIADGAAGALEGLFTLLGPSPEELYAGAFNPELAKSNEARQQSQQAAIGGIIDATKKAWNDAEARNGTAGAAAMVLTSLGTEVVGGKGVGALGKVAGNIADIVKTSKTPLEAVSKLDLAIATAKKNGASKGEIELLEKAKQERLAQHDLEHATQKTDGVSITLSAAEKGALGEKVAHAKMKALGYERIDLGGDYVHGRAGIDGIYRNTKPPPEYVIMEAKYGAARLGKTADGKQMSKGWIEGNDRLKDALSAEDLIKVQDALDGGEVKSVLIRVEEAGKTKGRLLNSNGNIIRDKNEKSILIWD